MATDLKTAISNFISYAHNVQKDHASAGENLGNDYSALITNYNDILAFVQAKSAELEVNPDKLLDFTANLSKLQSAMVTLDNDHTKDVNQGNWDDVSHDLTPMTQQAAQMLSDLQF